MTPATHSAKPEIGFGDLFSGKVASLPIEDDSTFEHTSDPRRHQERATKILLDEHNCGAAGDNVPQ
jgi:hypothetical protein